VNELLVVDDEESFAVYRMKLIACIDADYRSQDAVTAVVGIHEWADSTTALERVFRSPNPPEPYVPGEFYRREMPGILAALTAIGDVGVAVIDGYVWLGRDRLGLGARLHEALEGAIPIVGVAKTRFASATDAVEVLHGGSASPLYVSAVGMAGVDAAMFVRAMHGPFRLPTLLKRVDSLARLAPFDVD